MFPLENIRKFLLNLCYFVEKKYKILRYPGKNQTNCLSVFGHFVGLALKGLTLFI